MKFVATIHYWRPERERGLAIAEIPVEHIAELGGLKQIRVRGKINGADFASNVWPAGSGRLALSVTKAMMRSARVAVGDSAGFEVERDVPGR